MGIVLTRYEDTANNNIKFDVSKFDYDYDDNSFPTDVQADVREILLEHGDMYKIIEVGEDQDTVDAMGVATAVDESTFWYAYAHIQPISQKDRQIHEMGLAVAGNQKVYFAHSYPTVSAGVATEHYVQEGYILVDKDGRRWRIETILGEWYFSNAMAYKVAVIKSIGNEGSNV